MKYDRFLAFSLLNVGEQELLKQYASPANESSVVKGVPLTLLDQMRSIARKIKFSNQRVNVRYRGPRYDSMRQTTLKRDARAFSVYLYN